MSFVRAFYGIQVAIHGQEDYPDINNPILAQPGYDVKVFVTPSVLTSDQIVCFLWNFKHNTLIVFMNVFILSMKFL